MPLLREFGQFLTVVPPKLVAWPCPPTRGPVPAPAFVCRPRGRTPRSCAGHPRPHPAFLWILVGVVHRCPLPRGVSRRRRRRWARDHFQARQTVHYRSASNSRSPFPRQRSDRDGMPDRISAANEVQEAVPGCVRGRDVRRHADDHGPGCGIVGSTRGGDLRYGRGAAPSRTLVRAGGGRPAHGHLLYRCPAVGPGDTHPAAPP